ncbi:hypothetical protein [Limnohabitans radicicola]|uniref:IPT/TIG domain-containing protein n=1 Tax=Limnohabitans radicicola TaxID=2771427 RepID=A0A927FKY7_9BURK|nr:hypothetical protein [Limnohabitans radicicola]MBD8051987.1 hypothetical protein [Limnohabitans radicicola]
MKRLIFFALAFLGGIVQAQTRESCGFSFNANNTRVVVFLNGIGNDFADVCSSSDALGKVINTSNFDRIVIHNRSEAINKDVNELRAQAAYSNLALKTNSMVDLSKMSAQQKTEYYKTLGGMYLSAGSSTEPAVRRIYEFSMYLADRLRKLSEKYERIVLVPHSQGNFYAEAAYAILVNSGNQTALNKIKVVGVASVAASSPNDVYMTNTIDAQVYGSQSANSITYDFYKPLPATDTIVPDNPISFATVDLVKTNGYHSFVSAYLNQTYNSKEKNQTLPSIIGDYVANALKVDVTVDPLAKIIINLNSYSRQTIRNGSSYGGTPIYESDMAISTIPPSALYDEVTMQGMGTEYHEGGVLRFSGSPYLMPQGLPYIKNATTIPAGTIYTFTFRKNGGVVGTKSVTLGVDIPFGTDLKSGLFPFPLYKDYSNLCTKSISAADMLVFPTDSLASYQRLNLNCQNGAELTASSVDAKYRQFSITVSASASPYVSAVGPSTLTRGVPTTVTVYGDRLPDTTVFSIESVVCNGNYTRTAWSVWQTCTAQPGSNASAAVWVKDGPNGSNLVDGDGTKRIEIP